VCSRRLVVAAARRAPPPRVSRCVERNSYVRDQLDRGRRSSSAYRAPLRVSRRPTASLVVFVVISDGCSRGQRQRQRWRRHDDRWCPVRVPCASRRKAHATHTHIARIPARTRVRRAEARNRLGPVLEVVTRGRLAMRSRGSVP